MGNMKEVFDARRQLYSKPTRRADSVRSKEGVLLTKEEDEVTKRWKEHFAEVLNRPPSTQLEVESEACESLKIETCTINEEWKGCWC